MRRIAVALSAALLASSLAAQVPSRPAGPMRKIAVSLYIAYASSRTAGESVQGLELTLTPLDGGSSALVTTVSTGQAATQLAPGRYRVRSLNAVRIAGVDQSWDVEVTVDAKYPSVAISVNRQNATRSGGLAADTASTAGSVVLNPSPVRSSQPTATPQYRALQAGDPGYKDPGISLLIGFLIVGGGHIYSGETGKGVGLLLGTAALLGVAIGSSCDYGSCNQGVATGAAMGALGLVVYSLIDAPSAAHRANQRGQRQFSLGPLQLRPTRQGLALSLPLP